MKIIKLISILLILTSCTDSIKETYHDAPTQFIISDIQKLDGMKRMTTYLVEVVDVNGLVHKPGTTRENLNFWFCDSIGKYKLGQPIHFDKNR